MSTSEDEMATRLEIADAQVILRGLVHDGLEARHLTPCGRREVIAAFEKILELTRVNSRAALSSTKAEKK